jgi:hypothetical protein
MKRLTFGSSLVVLVLTVLVGCANQTGPAVAPVPPVTPIPAKVVVQAPADAGEPRTVVEPSDRGAAEQVVKAYFQALGRHDCKAAYGLQLNNGTEAAFCDFWSQVKSIELVSLRGYHYTAPGVWADSVATDPIDFYMVTLNIHPDQVGPWNDGVNTRFVAPSKDAQNNWHLGSLATGP